MNLDIEYITVMIKCLAVGLLITMSTVSSGAGDPDTLKKDVLEELSEQGTASVDQLAKELDTDRETVRIVVRDLFRSGKVAETPDWDYRIANRF